MKKKLNLTALHNTAGINQVKPLLKPNVVMELTMSFNFRSNPFETQELTPPL